MALTYNASHNFFNSVNTFGNKISLAAAIDFAVASYYRELTSIAGRQVQLNLTRLCMGRREAWEHFRDTAGEHLASVRIVDKEGQEYLSFPDAQDAGARIAGVVFEKGDTLMSFRYETPEGLHCTLRNYRFTVETSSVEAFFPSIRLAMYREYLRLMCEVGQPEYTSIGL